MQGEAEHAGRRPPGGDGAVTRFASDIPVLRGSHALANETICPAPTADPRAALRYSVERMPTTDGFAASAASSARSRSWYSVLQRAWRGSSVG